MHLSSGEVCDQIAAADANRMTDAEVRQFAAFAEAVDAGRAHAYPPSPWNECEGYRDFKYWTRSAC